VVFLDPNGKASDVAARHITGFSNAPRRFQLAGVARPDEVFYDLCFVVISH
jgi:hypothetical protein